MSIEVSDDVREFFKLINPGGLWEWQWPVNPDEPDGGQIVAILDIRSTKVDHTVAIDWWYMSEAFQHRRPPGVLLGSNVPFQVFYDAAKAGKLVELQRVRHCDSDEEIIRKLLVRFMDEGREPFQTAVVIHECYADKSHPLVHPDRIKSVLFRMYERRLLSWHEAILQSDTKIRITDKGRVELRRPFTN